MNLAGQQMTGFRRWGRWKRILFVIAVTIFIGSNLLYLTPAGAKLRMLLAETAITTQHRDWAWFFVGGAKRDEMVQALFELSDKNAEVPQDMKEVDVTQEEKRQGELIKVEDISGTRWVGKKMYVYDPKAIRIVVPGKQGVGERVSSMVKRTGALAGVNAGGFIDPGGFGNGFAPIGIVMSGGEVLHNDTAETTPQHIVGFTKDGVLLIGKYSTKELKEKQVSEAVSFYPRIIANGQPLITSGDGGGGIHPRTALGQRKDGTVIFIVIDGRQKHSVGATYREVQDLLLAEGCVNAGFLDGGSSAEMVLDGNVITKPSSPDGGERTLPTAFLVFENSDDVKVNNIWQGLKSIDPGGTYDPNKSWYNKNKSPSPSPSSKPGTSPSTGKNSPGPSKSPSATKSPEPQGTKQPGNSTTKPSDNGAKNSTKPSPNQGNTEASKKPETTNSPKP
ncbi:phosphodiester glycosidase family protein [Paenibacillus sp. N1-5-1-14]|uniref:phosphodiester glycosidase family protein n=1 Tax=Paenibacillus radicibacter TaxID=2972488 RepID=UPI00215914EF|nr:phosphodiester glycosidase family protein [Paenibacillus radicibacter]MCR8643208.1 phosphodiester glycosidase family protein [Paenibacillus radicibacter]